MQVQLLGEGLCLIQAMPSGSVLSAKLQSSAAQCSIECSAVARGGQMHLLNPHLYFLNLHLYLYLNLYVLVFVVIPG